MLICDIMIYYYIIMVVYACLCSRYSCGLLWFSIGVLYPISRNAIFDDLRHFYIFMCISMLVLQNQLYKANTKGRNTQKCNLQKYAQSRTRSNRLWNRAKIKGKFWENPISVFRVENPYIGGYFEICINVTKSWNLLEIVRKFW